MVKHLLSAAIGALMLLVVAVAGGQQLRTSVTAADGVQLATDVYFPPLGGPWPVILQRTPYNKNSLSGECLLVTAAGYACVVQDTRGRYNSGGTDTVFRDDPADGRVTVAWIADQDWCDGNVGTFGGSALGITQYALAPGADPALKCLMPAMATPDLYHHAFLQGGAIRVALVENWLAGQGSLHFHDEVLQHRLFDEWWQPADLLSRSAEVTAAGLHVGGWYDIFLQGTLDAFRTLQNRGGDGARGRQYLVIGPWTHGGDAGQLVYPGSAIDELWDLVLPWYDSCLGDQPNAVGDWPAVRIFVMGAVGEEGAPGNEWRSLGSWPPAARAVPLYLDGPDRLQGAAAAASERQLLIDPSDPVPTLGGANLHPHLVVDGRQMGAGSYDQRSLEERRDVLTFTGVVLQEPLTVIGRITCRLWVRPDTLDLDLAVRLTDVYPDGRSMLVTDGIQRARMRCGDDRECLLTPGEPVEIVVDLWSTALIFNAGHRIRIAVSGTNSPRFEVNPNHGGAFDDDLPGVVALPDLLLGPDYPSRLLLPVPLDPRQPAGRRAGGGT